MLLYLHSSVRGALIPGLRGSLHIGLDRQSVYDSACTARLHDRKMSGNENKRGLVLQFHCAVLSRRWI